MDDGSSDYSGREGNGAMGEVNCLTCLNINHNLKGDLDRLTRGQMLHLLQTIQILTGGDNAKSIKFEEE